MDLKALDLPVTPVVAELVVIVLVLLLVGLLMRRSWKRAGRRRERTEAALAAAPTPGFPPTEPSVASGSEPATHQMAPESNGSEPDEAVPESNGSGPETASAHPGTPEVEPVPVASGPVAAADPVNAAGPAGAEAAGPAWTESAKDRLLRVLLTDPERALHAISDLEHSQGRLDQLQDTVHHQRRQLADAARRLRGAGLTTAQVARLAGFGEGELVSLLAEHAPSPTPRTAPRPSPRPRTPQ